ncbi:uncharacterized protein LOC119083616 [Bradysia coprophila]|uniref:uncharacterized protein LOC119083616 n=1 Tax=Bradysia coprophila TaxID=38358 RepID=UPI00187D9F0D|nr:uncharacterized protein LOC119083616 [Bradysia coprophila]
MVGFRYVANCLAIKGKIQEIKKKMVKDATQVSASALKGLLNTLNECSTSIPHQVGVFAIKQYFAGNLLKGVCHDFQLRIIRNLIRMDPENLEWRFCLYSVLRFKKAASKSFGTPSQEEIDVIVEAMDKRYAMFDARICLGYAFCLAEILKSSGKFVPIKYGRKVFHRESDVLECIRAKVDDVLAIDPTSVRSNIDVAKIYSSILPYAHRDTAFAMVCVRRALLFNPNSSKANHRMAVLSISTNSPSAALEYLKKAVENDARNVFATVDLLKVYMENIPVHKAEIKEILLDPAHKIGKHYTEMLILNAVYSSSNGNDEKSVDLLIEAMNTDAKCVDSLERLHSTFKRFNWVDYNSFSKRIKDTVELRLALCGRSERDVLTKILKSLRHSNTYGSHRQQSKPGRGKYEDFYNRSYGSQQSGYNRGSRPGSSGKFDYEGFKKSYGSY